MLNLKNERGSITLFVLVSCLFFIASVACTQIYMQSKQVAVNREYRQIKSNYEENNTDESMNNIYTKLSQLKNLEDTATTVKTSVDENGLLTVQFELGVADLSVNTIKYGWGEDDASSENIETWNYIENESIESTMVAVKNNVTESGDYYLFVVVDNEEVCLTVNIVV